MFLGVSFCKKGSFWVQFYWIFYKSGEKYITGSYDNDSLVGDYYVFDKDSKVIKSFKY